MEHYTRTFGNRAQGVISNMNRQAGLFSDQGIDSAKQSAATGKHQAPVDEVGREIPSEQKDREAAYRGALCSEVGDDVPTKGRPDRLDA